MSDTVGVGAALAKLDALKGDVRAAADAGHRSLAERQASEIRADAPVDTGRLASTIRVERESETVTEVVVGDETTDYLGFQEFGTVRQAARPFVRPAIGRAEAAHESTMTREARERIK